MATARIRTLVVDDFEPFRRFLCSRLAVRPDLEIVYEASDGLAAVHKAEELQPNLILLDISLPHLNGIEAAHRIGRVVPHSKIIIVTQNEDTDIVREALGNGASGYVLKIDARNEILPAIEAVLAGRQFVSSALRHKLELLGESRLRPAL